VEWPRLKPGFHQSASLSPCWARSNCGNWPRTAKQCATLSGNGKASEVAARLTCSNSRYVETVKAIQASAPEVIAYASSEQVNTKRPADQ
jgi:hypothetical protein